MIIVDTALKKRAAAGNPIKIGMIGAGFQARGIAVQVFKYLTGMDIVAISNRNVETAGRAYQEAGIDQYTEVNKVVDLEDNIAKGKKSITADAKLLCQADGIEAILEVTGAVDFGAQMALEAFKHKKHFVQMNAELDGTLGPILYKYAQDAGVIYTFTDGDQPGVEMNLHRFVEGVGLKSVLCGNIKGLHDPYRNPTTQESFAAQWKQKPKMVTSFADGTKISFEQAIVANGTGMKVAKRGMLGPDLEPEDRGRSIKEFMHLYPLEEQINGPGIVDYIVGAEPGPGVFVIGYQKDKEVAHHLKYLKMGDGPFYCFYTPYHLCMVEVPNSVARAVLFDDPVLSPTYGQVVDVVATAKVDLKAGQTIDGLGEYCTYGLCENSDIVMSDKLLPMGLAEGCKLIRDVPKDQVLTYADVILPVNRLADQLREEQNQLFYANA